MNNQDRVALGLPIKDRSITSELQSNIEVFSPISLDKTVKESQQYRNQSLKNINLGTLRNPQDLLTIHLADSNTYIPLTGGAAYKYAKQDFNIILNGNIDVYQVFQGIVDLENPTDPVSYSFNRLYSLSPRLVNSGKLVDGQGNTTGYLSTRLIEGDKELYYRLNSGSITGLGSFRGFFKKASTRQSKFKNLILASGSDDLLNVDTTFKNSIFQLPNDFNYVSYPQTYLNRNFKAFEYDTIIVPEILNYNNQASGFNGVLLISTGLDKNIVYISPHNLETFSGFSYVTGNRSQRWGNSTGENINIILQSGRFLAPTSNKNVFTGISSETILSNGVYKNFYNTDAVRLQQATPIKDTNFYKLYEKVYLQNSFNTGTWDGIIPKNTPFSIEIVRTNNSLYGHPDIDLKIFTKEFFVKDDVHLGSGHFNSLITDESREFGVYGTFFATALKYSNVSEKTAFYLASTESYKKCRAKVMGCLWDKGFSVTNNKVRNTVKLFNNGKWPNRLYCETFTSGNQYYTRCESGILTSAGVRKEDGSLVRAVNKNGIGGFKFTRAYETIQDVPSGSKGKFFIKEFNNIITI